MIRLSKSCLDQAEIDAVTGVLRREFLGMGSEVKQFEELLGEYFGRPAACVATGTAALHLAVQACGIGAGDEVILPTLTYVASFQAVAATGARPVACDVDEASLTLDPRSFQEAITDRTKAVMPVHYGGGVGRLDEVYDVARQAGLRVIEDAAHAFGSRQGETLVGAGGDVVCFSFDGIKNITSGEGGCVVSDDQAVMERIRDARLLGVQRDTERRFAGERSWEFDVQAQGWRYHMSNVMAAIGIEQFHKREAFARRRQELARRYDRHFEDQNAVTILPLDYQRVVPHIYPVRLREGDRDAVKKKLFDSGIETGIHYALNHRLEYFRAPEGMRFPVAERAYEQLLTLPMHPDLSDEDVDLVAARLLEVASDAA